MVSAQILVSKSYDAGVKHKELSLMFDNPKGRFLNSEINIEDERI